MKLLNQILLQFNSCFSRTSSFHWFVTIIIGLMIRTDKLGLTSIIRDLNLDEKHYTNLIHFFHSNAWDLEKLTHKWIKLVYKYAPLVRENNAVILISDGVKQSKEARRMPGVKKMHQDSENSAKAEYIHGHMFGGTGILAGKPSKLFCIPLSLTIQDGLKPVDDWTQESNRSNTHVVETIHQAHTVSKIVGHSILLLDRYFLSVPALEVLNTLNQAHQTNLHMVTKAKKSCKAYEEPPAKSNGRGRPRKKGETVKVMNLFEEKRDEFENRTILLYGEEQEVRLYSLNLLWGQKLYQKLKFVLVEYKGVKSILVSTNLALSSEAIVKLYGFRFKIECTFRELKQVIGGFSYQFWSKSLSKLNYYQRKDAPHPLSKITAEKDRANILRTIKAIEGYVLCSSIALGLLQLLSLEYGEKLKVQNIRFLRTQSSKYASEATIMTYARHQIYLMFGNSSKNDIVKIINVKQKQRIEDDSAPLADVA